MQNIASGSYLPRVLDDEAISIYFTGSVSRHGVALVFHCFFSSIDMKAMMIIVMITLRDKELRVQFSILVEVTPEMIIWTQLLIVHHAVFLFSGEK